MSLTTIASGLDRLIVYLDGIDQREYAKYRVGGIYQKVIDGIKELVYWKKELKSKGAQAMRPSLLKIDFKNGEWKGEFSI